MVPTVTANNIISLIAPSLAAVMGIVLILFLIPRTRQRMLASSLKIIAIPVLVGLAVIASLKVAEILLAGKIALLLALIVIGLLTTQCLSESSGTRQKTLASSLNIITIPLLIGFAVIVGLTAAEILA